VRFLLDVNVLVALFDDAHAYSAKANAFIAKTGVKIASCPLTENGIVRVMNAGQYAQRAIGFERVRTQLNAMSAELDHEFWPDDVSIREARHIDLGKIHGHTQISDAYLLALAVSRGGALLTVDQRISLGAVPGATTDNLLVLQ
jgi:uncharacterized protein